jgi:hydroxymethyl cephem carbamoyltransferase
MALAAFSDRTPPTDSEKHVIDFVLSRRSILLSTCKNELKDTPIFNIGVESAAFKSLAGKFSDAIFDRFFAFARQNLKDGFPLLIGGGCGLNCEWNTKWLDTGLFQDVFVPPCTNDTGSAIGTAVDAQLFFERKAKISWSVYAGLDFVMDVDEAQGFTAEPLNYRDVADFISADKVIAWVQGRYEMGPRALGNRSILANPLSNHMLDRINQIKQRESYRPIAPVCLEEDIVQFTDRSRPSPYMLFFYEVNTPTLPAVTHVDNSARFQTVNYKDNPHLYKLLTAFKQITGYGVLCNTSLNFKGCGFINRLSDLVAYAKEAGLDGFVVGNTFYRKV